MTGPTHQQPRALIRQVSQRLQKQFRGAVRPIYCEPATDSMEAVGSCVLLSAATRYFLVSASHVFEHLKRGPLYIGTADGATLHLEGEFVSTELKTGGDVPEKADFGFLELRHEYMDHLGPVRFIRAVECDPNEVSSPSSIYFAIGYPLQFEGRDNRLLRFDSRGVLFVGTPAKRHAYERSGGHQINSATHAVIRFDEKKVIRGNDSQRVQIRPKGMSGGGLWSFRGAESSPKLVGILDYHFPGGYGLLRAVRIAQVLEAIRERHPDVSGWIPQSNHLRIQTRWTAGMHVDHESPTASE